MSSSLSNKKRRMNFDDEEMLILAVEKKAPLWDFSLPLKERNSVIRKKLWNEVAEEFDGKYDADVLKVKFKSLHDTFRKIVQSENCPSGSARQELHRKWGHYGSMQFLRDSCLVKTTVSNLDNPNQETVDVHPLTDDEDNLDVPETANSSKTRIKNKRAETNTASILERIADSLSQNTQIQLSPPPEPDEVDSFLSLVGSRIRRLPPSEQLDTMQEILELTFQKLKK
ncbi:uncharacterized protein [Prorops nasuta]|uniref:uncharacterized protein n=1 Tax=Prorops nasuta TaxID=863751 RepID=UPI0034CE6044